MSKTIGIIPARSGSKGISNKNIKKLGGIPLVQWSITQALNSKIDTVIFDSDSNDYLNLVDNHNLIKSHRPSHLARDNSLTLDVIKYICNAMKISSSDRIVLLQPTCPFRDVEMINQCLDLLESNPSSTVISVVDCDAHHPLRMKRIVDGKLINYIDTGHEDMRPRQELPKAYIRSGSIYAASLKQINKNNGFGSNMQIPMIEDLNKTINIDSPRDFKLAEEMLATHLYCQNIHNEVQKGS